MMHRLSIRGAELCVETFGPPDAPPVLLIMGGAASMDRWEPAFCARLAEAGRCVIRYDHRDTGGSTTHPPGEPGYTGDDLWRDALGVLDALGVARAHLVGFSMGGALAQRIAAEEPGRLLSLTLMATSFAGDGAPELPGMSAALAAHFSDEAAAPPEPADWSDRQAVIDHLVEAERPWLSPREVEEDALREVLAIVVARSLDVRAGENHFAVDSSPPPAAAALREVALPALVVHGTDDPCFPPAHGRALAEWIPGARLLILDGVGHELPRRAWERVLPALVEVTSGSAGAA